MADCPWHLRARRQLRHSLKAQLVLVFLLLALALAGSFLFGMQKALGIGWRGAARPLVADYIDRLAAEVGTPPSVERARALTQRLPITVRITGPQVEWHSHAQAGAEHPGRRWRAETGLLARSTADGHRLEFGLDTEPWRDRPRLVGWTTLAVLLLLTALAYKVVRRLLRPLEDIRAGAQRFGSGRFDQPIPVRRRDELGDLASDVNAMASSIHQMLEAKRGLLLAISHELRSPITRARLHTELLPEDGPAGPRREALLRELQEMAGLVGDLLESERLGAGHAALHREPTQLAALVREAVPAGELTLELAPDLPVLLVDQVRLRLLLRNLVDNARRHGGSARRPVLQLAAAPGGRGVLLSLRDFGPGVPPAALAHLAEPFFRPDAARERATGGVGLGLYLCKLVANAHGGRLDIRNAEPGLEVRVLLPSA